jgi:hypothetical protein
VLQQAREDAGGARGQARNLLIAYIDVSETNSRLFHAVTALKPQAPATDKKTAFWNSYMKLADDYDKEFQQKYSTDLDTALIFVGDAGSHHRTCIKIFSFSLVSFRPLARHLLSK